MDPTSTWEPDAVLVDGRWHVFVRRTRCPVCGETDLKTQRSTQNGDETRTKVIKCNGCRLNFSIVVE